MQNFVVMLTFSILNFFLQILAKNQSGIFVAWLISQSFSPRDLKPVDFLFF